MSILRICEDCGFPITNDLRIAREQSICCCVSPKVGIAAILAPDNSRKRKGKMDEKELQAYRESNEFKERDKEARRLVEEAYANLQGILLEATFPFGIPKDVLLGMKFGITALDYKNNLITFTLVE